MTAKLVAEQGEQKGLVLNLEEGEQWLIGRDPDHCQLLIEDPSVSRKHLLCRKTPEGILIENLSDTNPALLNENELKESSLLQHGDTLTLGSGTYRFLQESTAHIVDETADQEIEEEEEPLHDSIYEEEEEGKEKSGLLAEIDYGLTDSSRWLLKVIGGPNNGAEFSMQPGLSYVIGTDPKSCDVIFHDTSVSRQHARIAISEDDTITIEDLGSRNGTFMDGEKLEKKETIATNNVITLGTTSVVVYDRDGEMQTIISPLLPSIVKILQKEEEKENEEELAETAKLEQEKARLLEIEKEKQKKSAMGGFMLTAMTVGLLALGGIGIMSLFQTEPIHKVAEATIQEQLMRATSPFPSVRYSFNSSTGQLLLVGHVLTNTDKSQLMYNLEGFDFIKQIDDRGIVIDEYVWREINQILARSPEWKGITVSSPSAGQFLLAGYLETRKEAEELNDYLTANFPYPDLLDVKVVVEEDVATSIETALANQNIYAVSVLMSNGELTLSGKLSPEHLKVLNEMIPSFRQINGVRLVKNFVTETEKERSLVDISDRYFVSGYSTYGTGKSSVIIDGKILTVGDFLDGMKIEEIEPNQVILKKDNVQYLINFKT